MAVRRIKAIVGLALLLILVAIEALAAEGDPADVAGIMESQEVQVTSETWSSFETLFSAINQSRQELAELRAQLNETGNDAERERIRSDIELLQSNIDSLQTAWEMWATGGVDLQLFQPKNEEKFDWRQEIQAVFEPIVVELQRLTERPRKLERLRTEQEFYQQRLDAATTALKNIEDYKRMAPTADLQDAFVNLESNWRKRHEGIKSRLTLINLQLDELKSSSGLADEQAGQALKELISGRLVNLLLAILAAAISYGILHMISRLYVRLMTHSGRRRPFLARAAHLSFMLFSVILALLAAVAVLYLRGDRILLGLLLIALVGAALTLQRTLPSFIKEAKILLNIGPVREGQRLIYNGLPWKVQSLNVYSALINPELRGGKLLLPLRELTELISRPYDAGEPWFPTRENDFVLLSDGTYGRVIMQSPETVVLRVLDTDKTYSVDGFLGSHPQNLSRQGFAVTLKFGIDYQYQENITTNIRQTFEEFISSRLKQGPFATCLRHCFVEFDEAAASSLNFLIFASFTGEAADNYYRIRRSLQTLAVDACNANNWLIPFNQMTVHMAKEPE